MKELEVGQVWEFEFGDNVKHLWEITEIDYKHNSLVAKGDDKYGTFMLNEFGSIVAKSGRLIQKETAKETIVSPNHYVGDHGLEVETVLQNFVGRFTNSYVAHRVASAIEYLLRSPFKNGLEDLKKARRNLDQAIEYIERNKINKL